MKRTFNFLRAAGYSKVVLLLLMLLPFRLGAQSVLNNYVEEGLKNNLALQQKSISVEKAKLALNIASSYFYPSVTVLADYTDGKGGRSIDIPIGDLLNPVYSTLNALTQSNAFPRVNNVKQDFFPNKFYDVKARATMPLLNTDIIINRQIKEEQIKLQELERAAYRRQLIYEIKKAYYGYLSAQDGIAVYTSMLTLAEEALRVNESLINNGKALPVYRLRTESEIAQLQVKLTEMKNKADEAMRYFNFLLNRSAETEILTDTGITPDTLPADTTNVSSREELQMLSTGNTLYGLVMKMKDYKWVPVINAFADYGAQDSKWNYSKDSRYYLVGLQLSLPVFEAFRTTYEKEDAGLSLKQNRIAYTEAEKQLELSATVALNSVSSAKKSLLSATKQLETATAYYSLVSKGYKEGVHTMLELTDARAQLTAAKMQHSIARFSLLTAQAGYERETAR